MNWSIMQLFVCCVHVVECSELVQRSGFAVMVSSNKSCWVNLFPLCYDWRENNNEMDSSDDSADYH